MLQRLQFLYRNKAVLSQSSSLVVATNHLPKLGGSQSYTLGDTGGQILAQQPRREPIILRSPSFALIEKSFGYLNPLPDSAQLTSRQAGHLVQKLRRLALGLRPGQGKQQINGLVAVAFLQALAGTNVQPLAFEHRTIGHRNRLVVQLDASALDEFGRDDFRFLVRGKQSAVEKCLADHRPPWAARDRLR